MPFDYDIFGFGYLRGEVGGNRRKRNTTDTGKERKNTSSVLKRMDAPPINRVSY